MDIIHDAPFGQLVRWLSGNRLFLYPEERPDFVLPVVYSIRNASGGFASHAGSVSCPTGDSTPPSDGTGIELDSKLDLEKNKVTSVKLQQRHDGVILVEWYTPDDNANPQNWSTPKKLLVAIEIWFACLS